MASTTFVSQNIGAGNQKRATLGTKISVGMAVLINFVIAVLLFVFADFSVRLFTSDPEVIRAGAVFLHVNTFFLLFNTVNHVLAGALRGHGDSRAPMIIMLIGFVAIRQTYLYLITHYVINVPWVVGFGYPVGWTATCIMETLYFYYRWNHPKTV
jgi:Na+-driven multidrug efflux pump